MTIVLVLGLVTVIGVVAAGAARRVLVDERQSVRDYQQTIETLRHIGDRNATVRPVPNGASSRSGGTTVARAGGDAPSRAAGTNGASDGRAEQVPAAVESAPAAQVAHALARTSGRRATRHRAAGRVLAYSTPARRTTKLASSSSSSSSAASSSAPAAAPPPPAPSRRNRSPEPKTPDAGEPDLVFDDTTAGAVASPAPLEPSGVATPTAAVRELASGHAAAVAASERSSVIRDRRAAGRTRRSSPLAAVAGRPGTLTAAGVVVVVGAVIAGLLSTNSSHPSPAAGRSPVVRAVTGHSAAAAETSALQPVSSSSNAATYRVPAGPYSVVLSATGACWVMATDPAGHVLWTGTLRAGQTQTVPASGAMLLHLGAAWNVTITATGRPVQLPAGYLSPFAVTFSPA